MKYCILLFLLMGILSVGAVSPVYADNLLQYPFFDTGKLHTWERSGMIAGTGIGLTLEQYKSPDYSAEFVATTNADPTSLRLHQDFDVTGGTSYLGSAWLLNLSTEPLRGENKGSYAFIAFRWLDSGMNFVGDEIKSDYLVGPNNEWERFTVSAIAPEDATFGRFILGMHDRGGYANDTVRSVFFDNARVCAVPEPVSTVLFITGGSVLAIRRIRKIGEK